MLSNIWAFCGELCKNEFEGILRYEVLEQLIKHTGLNEAILPGCQEHISQESELYRLRSKLLRSDCQQQRLLVHSRVVSEPQLELQAVHSIQDDRNMQHFGAELDARERISVEVGGQFASAVQIQPAGNPWVSRVCEPWICESGYGGYARAGENLMWRYFVCGWGARENLIAARDALCHSTEPEDPWHLQRWLFENISQHWVWRLDQNFYSLIFKLT